MIAPSCSRFPYSFTGDCPDFRGRKGDLPPWPPAAKMGLSPSPPTRERLRLRYAILPICPLLTSNQPTTPTYCREGRQRVIPWAAVRSVSDNCERAFLSAYGFIGSFGTLFAALDRCFGARMVLASGIPRAAAAAVPSWSQPQKETDAKLTKLAQHVNRQAQSA